MRSKLWVFVALLVLSFTIITCSAPSNKLEQPQEAVSGPTPSSTNVVDTNNVATSQTCNLNVSDRASNLDCAVVDKFENDVLIDGISLEQPDQQGASAQFTPPSVLETGVDASATLVFNELSMAEAGPETEFKFERGLDTEGVSGGKLELLDSRKNQEKAQELFENTILISDASLTQEQESSQSQGQTDRFFSLVPPLLQPVLSGAIKEPVYLAQITPQELAQASSKPEIFALQLKTQELQVSSNGAVYLVKRNPDEKKTQVFSLSERPIKVIDNQKQAVTLQGDQTVIADANGFIDEQPAEYDLEKLYSKEPLLEGLAPGQEDIVAQKSLASQLAYYVARSETLTTYHNHQQKSKSTDCPETAVQPPKRQRLGIPYRKQTPTTGPAPTPRRRSFPSPPRRTPRSSPAPTPGPAPTPTPGPTPAPTPGPTPAPTPGPTPAPNLNADTPSGADKERRWPLHLYADDHD